MWVHPAQHIGVWLPATSCRFVECTYIYIYIQDSVGKWMGLSCIWFNVYRYVHCILHVAGLQTNLNLVDWLVTMAVANVLHWELRQPRFEDLLTRGSWPPTTVRLWVEWSFKQPKRWASYVCQRLRFPQWTASQWHWPSDMNPRMFREEDGRRLQGPLQGRHVNGRGLRVTLPLGRCPDVTYCNRSHHSIHIYNIMLSSATP